jgi:hypothetical protein
LADLKVGEKVEVDGEKLSDTIIQAKKVKVEGGDG